MHHSLSTDAFWAFGRDLQTVQQAAEGSLNFGVFDFPEHLCAYARVVTDRATFTWLCDVYVDREYRGKGIGLLLSRAVVDVLAPLGLKRVMLSTLDAHRLYEQVGFVGPSPLRTHRMVAVIGPSVVWRRD